MGLPEQVVNHSLDAIIVVIYLVLSFGFGLAASKLLRSDASGEEGYFLAGRKVPGWMNGISYAVTAMNADVAPTYCGVAVVVGLPVAWFYLSRFGLGLIIVALLFALKWRQLGISTGPEFFALRYGGKYGGFVRVYSSIFGIFVGTVPWIGAGIIGVHMIFGPIFGIESRAVTLAIILPALLAYVWISGFAGVIITDTVQTFVILAANIMLVVMVLYHFGGPGGLTDAIRTALPEESGEVLSALPVPGHEVFGPLVVLAWMIVPTIGVGGTVMTDGQRIFSCRNPREAAKVPIWGEIALFAMLLLLTLPTLGALALHPELYHATPAEREEVYGILLRDFLPVGFLGVALAALLSSVMSTIDSHLNFGAQTLLNDVYRPLFGDPGDRRGVWIGRGLMFVVLLSAIAVVYFSKSLIGIAVLLTGLFGSSATFAWAQWWWYRVNFVSWLSAVLGGPVIYFGLGYLLDHWDWWNAQVAAGEAQAQGMAMVQAVLAMIVSTTIWVTATLLTKPEKEEVLKDFYRRAKPLGHWGPVREKLIADGETEYAAERPKYVIAGGLGGAVVGFAWIALAVLAIGELFVGRYLYGTILAIAAVVLAFLFKGIFSWHIKRMEA